MSMVKENMRQPGFTLLEFLVVIAILGVLVSLASPYFSDMMQRQKIRSALNEWKNSFYFAQREAMRLKEPVRLCASNDGVTCATAQGMQFNRGWVVLDRKGAVLQDNAFNDPTINIHLNTNHGLAFMGNGSIGVVSSTGGINASFMGATVTIGPLAPNGNITVAPNLTGRNVVSISISAGGRLIGVKR